jgi:hypothetical protein
MSDQFDNVSVKCKANIYFDGKVVSHTVLLPDGSRKTIGLIYPGEFKFNTDAPEKMEIIGGACRVMQAASTRWEPYASGTSFRVPGKSYFQIAVDQGIAEYICTFE